jgi:epoxyqueuosine reductase
MESNTSNTNFADLTRNIKTWGKELGFNEIGISDTDLSVEENHLQQWLHDGRHGEMDYMARHGTKRARPHELVPGTVRVISVRLNYVAPNAKESWSVIADPDAAFISRYTLGRDYHKVMRNKLQKLADKIHAEIEDFSYRVFTDSAPVMEVALARKAGIGWRGKHTLLLTRDAGSMFFLGELFTNLPLVLDQPTSEHCGICTKCIDICPTQAITAPYQLDARRCISYLTIENKGAIPEEFRAAMGNRIYGCDDCQLICPWNKYAKLATEIDFNIRHQLDDVTLIELFNWSEQQFNDRMEGSAIRRIGFDAWSRNIAVALGNALATRAADDSTNAVDVSAIVNALHHRREAASEMVREHIDWALSLSPSPGPATTSELIE